MQLWATILAGTAGDAGWMLKGLASPGAGVLVYSRFTYTVFSTFTIALLCTKQFEVLHFFYILSVLSGLSCLLS
jgi:hypothetical protein